MKVKLVTEDELKVLTIDGFVERFDRELGILDEATGKYPSQHKAWERTEAVYKRLTGEHRFKTFNAFRMALVRWRRSHW